MPQRIWPLAMVFLVACTATARVPDGIQFRSENWYQAAESGFVVAPTAELQVVTAGGEAAATFTNHLYFELRGTMPGTPLVSPERALYLLGRADEEAADRLTATRMALVRDEPLDPDRLTVLRGEEVRRYTYERVYGQLTGVVIDLWQDEILWRGWADYQTARLYGEDGGIRKELERSRRAATIRLADFLGRL